MSTLVSDALDTLKEETNCDHEATVQLTEYLWTCKCGRSNYMKATPELRQMYEELIRTEKQEDVEIDEMFGIKIVRSVKL